MKKIVSLVLIVVSLFSVLSISVYGENVNENEVTVTVDGTEFIFDANTSEEFRDKAINHYFNHDDGAAPYGLICTLFGHKIESSVIIAVKHNVRATSPKCLEETYNVETCSRCDYVNSTLLGATYIVCC